MSRKMFTLLASLVSTLALSLGMMTASPASADESAPGPCDQTTESYVATVEEVGKDMRNTQYVLTFLNCSSETVLGVYAEAENVRHDVISADQPSGENLEHGESVVLEWLWYALPPGKWKFEAWVNWDPDRVVEAGTHVAGDPYAPPPKTKTLPKLNVKVMACKVRVTLNNRRVEEDVQFMAVFRKKHRTVKRNVLVLAESRTMLLQPRRRSRMVVKGYVPGLDSVKRVRVAVPATPNC